MVCDPTMLWAPCTGAGWRGRAGHFRALRRYLLLRSAGKDTVGCRALRPGERISVYYINYGRPIPGIHSIKPLHIREFLNLIMNVDCVFFRFVSRVLFALYFHRPFFYYNRANFFQNGIPGALVGVRGPERGNRRRPGWDRNWTMGGSTA